MGWSDSQIMRDLIKVIQPEVPSPLNRKSMYKKIIKIFEHNDWDVHSECLGVDKAWDAAFKELDPESYKFYTEEYGDDQEIEDG